MLARLTLEMPYTITVIEGDSWPIYQAIYGEYEVFFLGVERDESLLTSKGPAGMRLNGKPAVETNLLRIDFRKQAFNRTTGGPFDPPEDLIRRVLADYNGRLRYVTRARYARPPAFPRCRWAITYTKDDGSQLEHQEGCARTIRTGGFTWNWIGMTAELWTQIFELPPDFQIPVWDELRLDAHAALPHIGSAVALAATSLEVFISVVLDELAKHENFSPDLWAWITERPGGHWLRQPGVDEQFDVLLKQLCGHSLKEETALWGVFSNLKSARNNFVHEGVARISKKGPPLTLEEALTLLTKSNGIFDKIREWLPADLQWPITKPTPMQFVFPHPVFGPVEQQPGEQVAQPQEADAATSHESAAPSKQQEPVAQSIGEDLTGSDRQQGPPTEGGSPPDANGSTSQ